MSLQASVRLAAALTVISAAEASEQIVISTSAVRRDRRVTIGRVHGVVQGFRNP